MAYRFFSIFNQPFPELLQLLRNNVIGTPGQSMLYQHLEVDKKARYIPDPYFVNLKKGNTILGTCCFCSRDTINAGRISNSYYLRYFTFKASYRSSHKIDSKKRADGGLLRKEVRRLLDGEGLGSRSVNNFFHYAYVDPRNSRSLALCNEFGFKPVRTFSTVIFNRLFPKSFAEVEILEAKDIPLMQKNLQEFYKTYTMLSFENLFNRGSYLVIRDKGKNIVAGLQVNPDSWNVREMPGISGKIILNLFSVVPLLNRLINKKYKFITVEGVFVLPGFEKELEKILETALAIFECNSAMLWLDKHSDLYDMVQKLDLGLVDTLNKEVVANVICKFVNMSKEEQDTFVNNPAYISGTDLT